MAKVAIAQMCPTNNPEENLTIIKSMVLEAINQTNNLDVICFPEYCYTGLADVKADPCKAENIPGLYTEEISKLARTHKINIVAGSFVESAKDGRNHNTCLFFNRDGQIIGQYRKIHLMDAMRYRESKYVQPGNEVSVFDTDFGRVGMMVCYDLRFPELARTMALQGAEIIFIPSAFPAGSPLPPRTDHWDLLTQSTALYNTVYVVAANQFGQVHGENPFGRSSVIDPWGTRIVMASGRQEIIYANLNLEYQKKVKESLAIWENRRPDLYEL